MRKILLVALCFIMLFGCHKETTQRLQIDGIVSIEYKELIQNLNSDVTFMLYIGRPDCGDCQEFYPILEEYIKEHPGSGVYYLNIKEFRDRAKSEDATQDEKAFYENLYKELHFDWTPTIHIISNGKFIESYQYLDEDYVQMTDRVKQKEKRQEFLDEFQEFMDDYFKEDAI